MKNFTLTKEELLEQYQNSVNEIFDECDWKTTFSGQEVCGLVYGILTKNNMKHPMLIEEFYEHYSKKCSELASSDSEWRNNFGVKEIIDIIYDLLIV
jgi:hypothetical protein